MEGDVSSFESENSEPPARCQLLVLHTVEAHEWATYLKSIFKSSEIFPKGSISLHAVDAADPPHECNFDRFHGTKCIVLLLTAAFLDIISDPELHGELERLLQPPRTVVVLLCGVTDDMFVGTFQHSANWRKLSNEDEPAFYISTIRASIADSIREEAECRKNAAVATEEVTSVENPLADKTEKEPDIKDNETVLENADHEYSRNLPNQDTSFPENLTCVTVQPNRVLCGDKVTIFIILKHRVDNKSNVKVEFSSESGATVLVPGTLENEYTISVSSPDMPNGDILLTMHTEQSSIALKPVTYYTNMTEVSHCLEKATAPMDFLCQAFNITSNRTEILDSMLTESLKSKMPATGFQLFGVGQIEEDNMATYQRDEELPTLLHFAAKYGLKELTTVLLQCPGALQAYSVVNKHGDYPNTLAERSGFSDLRNFIDDFVKTAHMLQSHLKDSVASDEDTEVYELMSGNAHEGIMKKYSSSMDIYESMLDLSEESTQDLYEVMNAVEESQNSDEDMLIRFFQVKPEEGASKGGEGHQDTEVEVKDEQSDTQRNEEEQEEDPYNFFTEDIYDTVDGTTGLGLDIFNRPPAPIPRPAASPADETKTYISRVFSEKVPPQDKASVLSVHEARPVVDLASSTVYDPYRGVKTPGQRQLIALQERVKVGSITVEEAVQEFKAWQFDHKRRSFSLRYQQDNLRKLRDSIERRRKEKEKTGKEPDLEITAPLLKTHHWDSNSMIHCAVYEPMPSFVAPPPVVSRPIQRDTWKTGSTSSTSSSGSNRLSTHSTISYSSGTEAEYEDAIDGPPPPPRASRPPDVPPAIPPPRIPPRNPERVTENTLHERYISCPTRAPPRRPAGPPRGSPPPPVPRRTR